MSKTYETTGTIHSVGATQEIGANGFTKREFIIKVTGAEENPTYPNYMKLELHKEKTELISKFQQGQEIKICFNANGRLWTGNGKPETCFVNLVAWKVEAVQAQAPTQQSNIPHPTPQFEGVEDNGDIPF